MPEPVTVMIVDDEAMGREALEGVLYPEGYNLIFAESGEEAYRKALENTPDLVLLDVMMPFVDGFEVCRRMRANPLLAEIPILFVTALDDRASRIKGIEAGADDFITKPFDRIELRARVKTITRLNRYRRLLVEKARFAWVIDHAKEGYLILSQRGMIAYANSVARELLSLPANDNELEQYNFEDWVRKQFNCEPEDSWREWKEQVSTPKPLYMIRPETEGSKLVWLHAEVLNLPPVNTLVRVYDVTDQFVSMQDEWKFHNVLAHKFRTPISSVVMAAELLNEKIAYLSPEEVADIAQAIKVGTWRIQEEIDLVLRYINLPVITNTSSRLWIGEMGDLIFRISEEVKIPPAAFTNRGVPPDVLLQLSRSAMEMILTELFENAKKFHPNLSPQVEVAVHLASKLLIMKVKDDGVHLTPKQLNRAFTPYYQAEKYFTGEVHGMGLGLATIASIVWSAGGTCRLYNREDRPGIVLEMGIPIVEQKPERPLPGELG